MVGALAAMAAVVLQQLTNLAAQFLTLNQTLQHVVYGILGCGACWKGITRLLYPVIKKWLASSCCGCLFGCGGPTLGFLYVVALRRTQLGAKAMETLNNILGTSTPLKATEVSIQYLKVRIGFWVGVRIRVSGVRVVLDWRPEDEWTAHADAVREGVKKGLQSVLASQLASVSSVLHPPGSVGLRVKGIVERILNHVDVAVRDVQICIPCGDVPVELGLQKASIGLGRCWAYEQGGTKLSVGGSLSIRAAGEDLLEPLPLQVTVKMPRLLRTLLNKVDTPKILAKKKLDASVTVQAVNLSLRPKIIGSLLKASDNFAKFSQWKAPLVDEVQSSQESLKSTDKPQYVAALKAKKDASHWEDRIILRDAIAVHSEVEKWPIPGDTTLEDWLGELQVSQMPARWINWQVAVKSLTLEALTDDGLRGHGVSVLMQGLSLDGDVHIASAVQEPTALIVKPMALTLDTKLAVQSIEITCEKLGTFSMPVLEPSAILATLNAGKEDLSVSFNFQEAEVHDHFCTLSLSPRAIYKLECVAADFGKAMPLKAPPPPEMAMLKVRARERAHRDDVARRFARFDRDNSGELNQEQVHALVNELFGDKMTAEELRIAGVQLYNKMDRDGDGGITLDEVQSYFKQAAGGSATGAICIKLGEYARELSEDFDAWYAFEHKILQPLSAAEDGDTTRTSTRSRAPVQEDPNTISMKLLQLRWVRTVENYEEARRTWKEVIAPRLKRSDIDWVISRDTDATDFWNNPILQLSDLDRGAEEEANSYTLNLRFEVSGLSLRYSDLQMPLGAPRVRFDIMDVKLAGSVLPASPEKPRITLDLSGGTQLKASYWNEEHARSEPLLEDWHVDIHAAESSLSINAPKHMVINLTPPLLQAVGVLTDSLSLSGKDRSAILRTIPKDYEKEAQNAACWIVNLTGRDLKISLDGPNGKGKPVAVPKTSRDKAVKIGLDLKTIKAHQMSPEEQQFSLRFESQAKGEWSLSEPVRIGVAGRRVHLLQRLNVFMLADVSLDVQTQAPIITLSGLVNVANGSPDPITLDVGDGKMELASRQLYCPGLGGNSRIRFGDRELKLPGDAAIKEMVASEHSQNQWRHMRIIGGKDLQDVCNQHGLRAWPLLSPVINHSEVKALTIVFVPIIRLTNCLPAKIKCGVKKGPEVAEKHTGKAFHSAVSGFFPSHIQDVELAHEVPPGGSVGFDDVNMTESISIPLEFEGHKYAAVVKGDSLRKPKIRKLKKKETRSGLTKPKVIQLSEGAPYIDCVLEWPDNSATAVLTLFSRWIVANKTGRHVSLAAGSRFSVKEKQELVQCWSMKSPSWPAGEKIPPHYAMMHCTKGYAKVGTFSFSLLGHNDDPWAWDQTKAGGDLLHWPSLPKVDKDGETAQEEVVASETAQEEVVASETAQEEVVASEWSEPIPATIATSAAIEVSPAKGSTMGGGIVGVSVDELPFPFERTRIINITPRFVVVNRLEQAVRLWPCRGKSRHAPSGLVPANLPVAIGGGACVAIDNIEHTVFHLMATYSQEDEPMVAIRFDDEDMDDVEATMREIEDARLTKLEQFNQVRKKATDALKKKRSKLHAQARNIVRRSREPEVEEEPHQPLQEPDQPAADDDEEPEEVSLPPGRWSYCVPLWSPGDTLCRILKRNAESHDEEDLVQPVVIRASVQQEGSTNFVVISEGSYPFCIQNRSVQYTLVFSQVEDSTGAPEMIVHPCQYHRFTFPDPDAPQKLIGRIRGAGELNTVQYSFEDLSHASPQPLTFKGQLGDTIVALEARMKLDGSVGTLVFHNPKSMMIQKEQDAKLKSVNILNEVVNSLDVGILMAGIHVCLVDTSRDNEIDELLAFTVDYIEFRKPQGEDQVELDVYHVQIDDFHSPDQFIFGPRNSGLNSRRQATIDKLDNGCPWFSVKMGWKNLEAALEYAKKGVYTLEHVVMELNALEVYLDVPKLLQVANNLISWLSVNQQFTPDAHGSGAKVLASKLASGISVPTKSGQKLLFLNDLVLGVISLQAHVRFSSRRGEHADDDEGNTDEKLAALMAALPPVAQPILSGLSHASLSFADVSPHFRFGKFTRENLYGTVGPITNSIKDFYIKEVKQQAVQVLGSIKLLGDPTKVVGDVKKGFGLLISETGQELRGEAKFRLKGVVDFAETILSSAFGAVADSTGALKDTLGGIAGTPIGDEVTPKDLAEGIDGGMAVFADGFSHAISDIVLIPKSKLESPEYEEKPIRGALLGIAQGVYAIGVRPIEGTLGGIEKITRGAENAVIGRTKGFDGWRRPLRNGFQSKSTITLLDEGLFWPLYRIKLLGLSLMALWEERRVSQITISLERRSHSNAVAGSKGQIVLDRGEEEDAWVAVPRFLDQAESLQKDEAYGRVGDLVGPMRLQVDALLQGNIGMVEPIRQAVGYGILDTQQFVGAISRFKLGEGLALTVNVDIVATKSQIEGGLHKEGDTIGKVEFQFGALVDQKTTPLDLVPAEGGVLLVEPEEDISPVSQRVVG